IEVAALMSDPTIELLPETPEVLDQAVAAGVLQLQGDRVHFAHPLLAAAVAATIGPRRRQALHARLAEITPEPEESARHLALSIDGRAAPLALPTEGRDAAGAYALERAADPAGLRGAPAAGAEPAELAAERTPREDEAARFRRLNEAGLRYAIGGDFQQARAVLEPLGD